MGYETPVLVEQVYPGDRFRISLAYQMQLAPMLNPVYDGLEVNFEAFFVPNRIIDTRWKEFWTGYNDYDQMTPTNIAPLRLVSVTTDSNTYQNGSTPRVPTTPIGIGSLFDFLGYQFADHFPTSGLPAHSAATASSHIYTLNCNAIPFVAYNRIFDDWYRNERVQQARLYNYYNNRVYDTRNIYSAYVLEDNGDGEDFYFDDRGATHMDVSLFRRNYKKDRFTTALPEPIIGGDVHIPANTDYNGLLSSAAGNGIINGTEANGFNLNALALGTIEQLKLAFKEYSYRMKDTYNGNRYVESIESHYGIRVPDSTLQRSLYLGSARDYVNFGEVYQTSSGDGQGTNGALGDYAGRGGSAGEHYLFDEEFYEHGFVFVLMCVTPMNRYFQGVKRMFTRFDRNEYFEPEYQNIGDDFLTVGELYNAQDATVNNVFGYNSRWIELKTRYNELHGDFANTGSMMYNWNFARSFDSVPTISEKFSQIAPVNKPFVDTDVVNDNYYVDILFHFDALRPVLAVESF